MESGNGLRRAEGFRDGRLGLGGANGRMPDFESGRLPRCQANLT